MDNSTLRIDRRGSVAVITLTRPEKLNALNAALRDEILSAAAEVRWL